MPCDAPVTITVFCLLPMSASFPLFCVYRRTPIRDSPLGDRDARMFQSCDRNSLSLRDYWQRIFFRIVGNSSSSNSRKSFSAIEGSFFHHVATKSMRTSRLQPKEGDVVRAQIAG